MFSLAIINLTSWALSSGLKAAESRRKIMQEPTAYGVVSATTATHRGLCISQGSASVRDLPESYPKINNPTSFLIGSHVVTGYLE